MASYVRTSLTSLVQKHLIRFIAISINGYWENNSAEKELGLENLFMYQFQRMSILSFVLSSATSVNVA